MKQLTKGKTRFWFTVFKIAVHHGREDVVVTFAHMVAKKLRNKTRAYLFSACRIIPSSFLVVRSCFPTQDKY